MPAGGGVLDAADRGGDQRWREVCVELSEMAKQSKLGTRKEVARGRVGERGECRTITAYTHKSRRRGVFIPPMIRFYLFGG